MPWEVPWCCFIRSLFPLHIHGQFDASQHYVASLFPTLRPAFVTSVLRVDFVVRSFSSTIVRVPEKKVLEIEPLSKIDKKMLALLK